MRWYLRYWITLILSSLSILVSPLVHAEQDLYLGHSISYSSGFSYTNRLIEEKNNEYYHQQLVVNFENYFMENRSQNSSAIQSNYREFGQDKFGSESLIFGKSKINEIIFKGDQNTFVINR